MPVTAEPDVFVAPLVRASGEVDPVQLRLEDGTLVAAGSAADPAQPLTQDQASHNRRTQR